MKYPIQTKAIIDVTKPPYNADNTGKKDCTDILRQVLDDILIREVEGYKAIHDKIIKESENGKYNYYVGLEAGRIQDGKVWITFPEYFPATRIVYFPKGTYLVSDTITYTLKNLKTLWYTIPDYDANRNIHFMGEDKENTVIKLIDNAKGFNCGKEKPLISFINNEMPWPKEKENANASFMNIISDITLDCGKGNPDVIGIKYDSANIGRIENVSIKTESGKKGITTKSAMQGVLENLSIFGFDYGVELAYTAMAILDNIDVSKCKKTGLFLWNALANIRNINSGDIPTVEFLGEGRYYFVDKNITFANDIGKNHVKFEEETLAERNIYKGNINDYLDYAFVDDFGAIGDYKTDSTRAIQNAMNSGKSTIIFGEGQYCINAKIKIPKTVTRIDFLYCSFATGSRLVGGEYDAAFEISEDSNEPILIENLYNGEQFKGHIRCFKHAAKRDVTFRNIMLMTAGMYFNSVPGSKVYFDNCFLTMGTYVRDAWIPGDGFVPVYCHIIPYEFHGQTVYGRQVNAERADIHMLNDNSVVLIDGFRTEGCGGALKSINNGNTQINLFNAGIGYYNYETPLFDLHDSTLELFGGLAFGFNISTVYNIIINQEENGKTKKLYWDDMPNFGRGWEESQSNLASGNLHKYIEYSTNK